MEPSGMLTAHPWQKLPPVECLCLCVQMHLTGSLSTFSVQVQYITCRGIWEKLARKSGFQMRLDKWFCLEFNSQMMPVLSKRYFRQFPQVLVGKGAHSCEYDEKRKTTQWMLGMLHGSYCYARWTLALTWHQQSGITCCNSCNDLPSFIVSIVLYMTLLCHSMSIP